ncbi:MAG: YheC/YheD family protein [Planctomycetota bacterium]|jgi:hypothetical protein
MDRIGFVYNFREGTLPRRAYITHRAVPMAKIARDAGAQLFMFSPRHLDPRTGVVRGYVVEPGGFEPLESSVPPVNGNWYLGSNLARNRDGLGITRFRKWARERGLDLYPDADFTQLVKDKLRTCRLVRRIDPSLHPRTEAFRGSGGQVQRFLDQCRTVFLKPRRGNRGRKIIVLGHDERGLSLCFYDNQERRTECFSLLPPLLNEIERLTRDEEYVIQAGVPVARDHGASFIVRVIMCHDGRQWQWIHKAVVAAGSGDVANTSQGGSNYTIDDLFARLYDEPASRALLEALRRTSFDLTESLDDRFGGRLMELAYDFLVDGEQRIHLVEINTQPGMAKPGLTGNRPFADIFHLSAAEQDLYDRLVLPHATYLARFLLARLAQHRQAREARPA